jgi:hypothetical protein
LKIKNLTYYANLRFQKQSQLIEVRIYIYIYLLFKNELFNIEKYLLLMLMEQ